MGTFSTQGIAPWILRRIIHSLNGFQTAAQISDAVVDDPNYGTGSTGIGETVAQRILDRRAAQQFNRFSDIDQLQNIDGLSQDKFQDMVYSFGVAAAEQFRLGMYDGVILDNFILQYDRVVFEDEVAFKALVDNPTAFKTWVGEQVASLAVQRTGDSTKGPIATQRLQDSCMESYFSGNVGAYALALWFFRFDQDNWFSFDRVHEEIVKYLDSATFTKDRTELRLFYGFENNGVLANPITPTGLPVVVNYLEQAISIWSGQLND